MKKDQSEINKALEDFRDKFEGRFLRDGQNLRAPSEEEAAACIDDVVLPALESVGELLGDVFDKVSIEKEGSGVLVTISAIPEVFRFGFGFTESRRHCEVKSSLKFQFYARKTSTVFEITNACDALPIDSIAEINAEMVVRYFDFNFWGLFEQREIVLKYHQDEVEDDTHFPYLTTLKKNK